MKEFFHSVRFKILICIAALLLGLMTYVAVAAGTQTLPEQVINTVTYPFVTAANAISNGVNGFGMNGLMESVKRPFAPCASM